MGSEVLNGSDVARGRSARRPALLLAFAGLLALFAAPPPASAAGVVYYAAPEGSGPCSVSVPCKVTEAVAKADDGDTVRLSPGEYSLPPAGVDIGKEIDFGATPGHPATLKTGGIADLHVGDKAEAVVHDLRLEGEAGLKLESGIADRIFVALNAVGDHACDLQKGTILRDSVCWAREGSTEAAGESNAINVSSGGSEGLDETIVLRNVTAYADNDDGNAIRVLASFGAKQTVDAANVIARSVNDVDIVAAAGEGLDPEAHINIVNSNFGDVADEPFAATVTPIGIGGNVSAAPGFLDASSGDFHVGAGSPTVDAGINDPAVGTLDLDGGDRVRAGCFGGAPIPDVGAYERSAGIACPLPPPLPPAPVEARKPVFRILKLKLNRRTGAGRVIVEVPGAGTISLTGSGVKLVRRRAPAAGGIVSLPIQTWAITKVRLKKRGKTKVRLKVVFEPRSGGAKRWARGVLLRKKGKAKRKKSHTKHRRG